MYILQGGIIDFLKTKDLPSTKICPLDLQSKDRQLRNSDLMMTYMIMVTGLAAAIAIFIGEVGISKNTKCICGQLLMNNHVTTLFDFFFTNFHLVIE